MASTKKNGLDEKDFPDYACRMTPEQCRAARAWLNWSQGDLAKTAGVGSATVKDFETGKRKPIHSTLGAMQSALEAEGIGFVFVVGEVPPKPCGISYAAPKSDAAH